jgi:hypothetical protein
MLKARSPFDRTPSIERSHHRHRPAGTSFPAVAGAPYLLAWYTIAFFVDQLNSVPSIHMRCRMTASLRATATFALRSPLRLASLIPHAFRVDHFGTRNTAFYSALARAHEVA